MPLSLAGKRRALALGKSARVAAEPDRRRVWHGDGPSPCHSPVAAPPAAAQPVTLSQPALQS
eukprot:6089656-Prymnesium_polylepis.1